jgi:hypothetical protein
MTEGINQVPTNAVTTTVNNVAIYSGGIDGGNALKLAVKLPNFVIFSVASGLSDFM